MIPDHLARVPARIGNHPIDRISEARYHIKGIAIVLEYAIEKGGESGDGATAQFVVAALSAIGHFADEISIGIDELVSKHKVTEVRG